MKKKLDFKVLAGVFSVTSVLLMILFSIGFLRSLSYLQNYWLIGAALLSALMAFLLTVKRGASPLKTFSNVIVLMAVILAGLAFTTEKWLLGLLTVLKLFDKNVDQIQNVTVATQWFLWISAFITAIYGIWRKKSGKGDVIIIADPDRLWRQIGENRPEADLRQATEEYLSHLVDRYQYLDFRGMGITDRVTLQLPLLDMFVPLKARIELPEGETWTRDLKIAGRKASEEEIESMGQRMSEPVAVLDLLKENDGLIILGDPGAGKTTFLKYLTIDLALGQRETLGLKTRLPVLVPLSAYANAIVYNDLPLDRFMAKYHRDRGVALPIDSILEKVLTQGGALFLLDGMDEVRDPKQRQIVIDQVADFFTVQRKKGNKFVLTSRIVGYREVRSPTLEGLVECTLVDFSEEDIEHFVEKWTRAIERTVRGQTPMAAHEAERERKELLDAVNRNPGVRQLAANPLLLTILALMKRQGVALPERRVELYQNYVDTLLKRWNMVRGIGRPAVRDLDLRGTLKILAPLALWMHETSPGVGLVRQGDLRRKLEDLYKGRGAQDPEDATDRFLADAHQYAGLLLKRGNREYGFIHLTFQEYLAAMAIGQQGQRDTTGILASITDHLEDTNWHEVILLTAGYLGIVQQREEAASDVIQHLIGYTAGEPGRSIVLAGEALVDVGDEGVTPNCRKMVKEALLETMEGGDKFGPQIRANAGRLMGVLGDERPGVGLKDGLPDITWVHVEAGPFIMGSNKEKDNQAYVNELRQFSCTLIREPFQISRYPVTVAQYQAFVNAGGYEHEPYWTEAGWEWRKKHGITGPEEYFGILQTSNHPRVGVSWYEAMAFCGWISEMTGQAIALPTEAQWERTARHTDGRIYPWGDEFHASYCNMRDTGIMSTSAVGIFPKGDAKSGAADLSGNVWEWCSTKWQDNYEAYQQKATDDPKGNDARVLRGGAFFSNQFVVRCAQRLGVYPVIRFSYLGFRVASPGL